MSEKTVLPPKEKPLVPAAEEPRLVEELQKMEYEPLLPVEKKLIAYSIGLGVALLFLFIWLSQTYFSGQH